MPTVPADESDDHTLVALARRGDRDAFGALYARHASGVYSLLLRMSGDAAVAEDLTHDAFLKAFGGLLGYRGRAPIGAWLKRMAANAWIDRFRRERRWQPLPEDLAVSAPDPAAASDVASLLRQLPPAVRTVLWLHHAESWTHAEIGRRFGRSESWSKSIVSRALRQLGEDQETSS